MAENPESSSSVNVNYDSQEALLSVLSCVNSQLAEIDIRLNTSAMVIEEVRAGQINME